MEETQIKEFKCSDENGNVMRLVLEPQEKYPSRYDLKYFFNSKMFKLQYFPSRREAANTWDLLELLSLKQTKEENAKNTD